MPSHKTIVAAVALHFASLLVGACSSAVAQNSHYPNNPAPLKQRAFTTLPLGSIRAGGWLLKQLELQRDGLTGHAEQVLEEVGPSSAWRGGDKENWEKSPYYIKGLVPLAYTLDDKALKDRAQSWIDWTLKSQRADGFYGPSQNDDWWPRMVSNYFLRDYAEATNDPRVVPFLSKYYRYMLNTLPGRPLKDWGRSRVGDDMDTAIWVYNRTREPFLLDLVDLMRKQAYDWPTIMHENTFQGFGTDFQPKHNVNVPQAMKMPAVSWQRTGSSAERTAIDAGDANLMREHGLSVGIQSGTEFLAGRSPSQGVEFCAIVEQMLSDETIVQIYGDEKYADRLEQMAFNALPAAWNRDLTALRYYTLPNHVTAHRGGLGFGQNYDNGIVYGPRSGFPCCCFNVHQGWPKFVQNSWVATNGNGLASIAYAPTTVTAKVGDGAGATATIVQETNYPFGEEIRFKITMSTPATFPLSLRTPAWCEKAVLTVNGDRVDAPKPGTFGAITRQWETGDEIVLTLPMKVRVERGVHNSASIRRGPLTYSLVIDSQKKVVSTLKPNFDEFEQVPTGAWNYALSIDETNPANVDLLVNKDVSPDANPFVVSTTPVKLTAVARKLPGWGLAWNGVVAFDPPVSPVQSTEPEERVTLAPFGSLDLRLTDFPVLGAPSRATVVKPVKFTFDDNQTTGWSWVGGGWWAHDGALRTSHMGGGAPGFKALIDKSAYTDVQLTADITPPPAGNAGVIFRVNHPAIGADAYEGYYVGIDARENQVVVGKANGKGWTPLKAASHAIAADKSTTLKVTAQGSRIEVRLNDETQPVITVTDTQWTSGQVGVRMYTTDGDHAISTFDNVNVSPAR